VTYSNTIFIMVYLEGVHIRSLGSPFSNTPTWKGTYKAYHKLVDLEKSLCHRFVMRSMFHTILFGSIIPYEYSPMASGSLEFLFQAHRSPLLITRLNVSTREQFKHARVEAPIPDHGSIESIKVSIF
jgi:hypothetical protein